MALPQHKLMYNKQEFIHKYAELQQQFHNKSEDYENELASRRMWQAQARNFERSLQTTTMGLVCFNKPQI
jgi:hypothetical protein